jgi:hypothetical protein
MMKHVKQFGGHQKVTVHAPASKAMIPKPACKPMSKIGVESGIPPVGQPPRSTVGLK